MVKTKEARSHTVHTLNLNRVSTERFICPIFFNNGVTSEAYVTELLQWEEEREHAVVLEDVDVATQN